MGENKENRQGQSDEQVVKSTTDESKMEQAEEAASKAKLGDRVASENNADDAAVAVASTQSSGNNGAIQADSAVEGEQETADADAAAELEALRAELQDVQAKADEYLDQLQRTAAEFQNSRKRQEKQLSDAIERANGSLIARLLPILDDFALAFDNIAARQESETGSDSSADDATDSNQAWLDGFRQINKKLHDILHDQGLELIDVAGEFDPTRHEAIASEPTDEVESGHIISVLRAGYEFKGQVLRPALVRVAA